MILGPPLTHVRSRCADNGRRGHDIDAVHQCQARSGDAKQFRTHVELRRIPFLLPQPSLLLLFRQTAPTRWRRSSGRHLPHGVKPHRQRGPRLPGRSSFTELWQPQSAHCHSSRTCHALADPQRGQRKPSGHPRRAKLQAREASSQSCRSNLSRLSGEIGGYHDCPARNPALILNCTSLESR